MSIRDDIKLMKSISILEQATKEAVRVFVQKRNLTSYLDEGYIHPQEDYLLVSDDPPIFVVADGVTLDFTKLLGSNRRYPDPSPAGEVSRLFCEAVIRDVKRRYSSFCMEDVTLVFKEANGVVADYNKKVGRTDISGNKTGFYSATGSFVVISGDNAYWASICDSFVAHFDRDMNLKFRSTGLCVPYAVINGEEQMADYLETGVFKLEEGDKIMIFTDGFEHYVDNRDFQKLFLEWGDGLEDRIAKFSAKVNNEDPENYWH